MDMVFNCGQPAGGIRENKILLKTSTNPDGATYFQYQDGTNAVKGVEIFVKSTSTTPNRVAMFQEDRVVLEQPLYTLGSGSIQTPLLSLCFGFFQRAVNQNHSGLMCHSPVYNMNADNKIFWMRVPTVLRVHSISFSTDDGGYNEHNYTFQVYYTNDNNGGSNPPAGNARGGAILFSDVDENHYEFQKFSNTVEGEPLINFNESIGLDLQITGVLALGAEICVKLWCYQV
jgi:hypothetical protein